MEASKFSEAQKAFILKQGADGQRHTQRFLTLADADAADKIEAWLRYSNEDRPHGAIGHQPPITLQNSGGAPSPPP